MAQVIPFRKRQYAAAKTSRSTGSWSPVDSSINTIIGLSGATVRARVRQLIRDFPYFARAAGVIVDHVVGSGIKFQSRVSNKSGKVIPRKCQLIEDSLKFWADEADVAGKLHLDEMVRLCKRQDVECGEFLLIKREVKDPTRFIPFALQIYEADWLTTQGAKPAQSSSNVDQGIEYDTATGRVLAAHFSDPDSYGKPVRVEASQIIHGFETLRPGQLRGISPFTPGVIVTHDLQDIMDAEIDAAKLAAKWLAFVNVQDPAERQSKMPGADGDGDQTLPIEDLENGIIEYLRPGETVELASNPRPSANFPPFVRLVLGMLSVSTGVPYELLSGDYQGLNYSVSRASRNDFAYNLRPIADRHIRQCCQPIFHSFLEASVLAGKLPFSDYFTNPYPYRKAVWHTPGMEPVDPLKEIKANVDEMAQNLRSPQEIVARRGRDLEDVYDEIAQAKELADLKGLATEEVSTAMQTNPAALNKEKDEEKI